ncbi:hypothetical protein LUCX_55 [Xanthomonas phage vB_XciM_LucasX]|nr:hypothetical protein LUCX_55 [Xanthomonas phage vB_XciM_LucasX]
MLEYSDIKLETTVSFDLYPASYLGTSVKNAKVVALVNAATAIRLGFDPVALHAAVYPTLPPGTPNRYDGYQYLILRTTAGQEILIGVPWIKESTWVEEVINNVTFYCENLTPDQRARAVQALSAIGIAVAKQELS